MEEDRIEVPLYGQVEACVKLQAAAPKDAEFYVVVQGSALTHVTRAKRGADALSLSFIVPGHALAEAAALTSFCCAGQQIQPCVCDGSSVTYLRDAAQEAAEYLRANREQPGPPSYPEALQMFSRWTADPGRSPGPAALGQLDEKMARAAANMDYLQQWDDADARPGAEAAEPKETLLHLAGRLGLVHLARHLTHRMRGQRAATSAGQDGEMPPELAQKNGLRVKFGELSVPRCQCVRRLWSDGSCALGFFPGSDQVTLTVRRTAGSRPEEAIMILRDKLGDESIVQLMDGLKADGEFERRSDGFPPAQEGTTEEDLQAEEHAAADDVFQEHLVLCLDDDDNFEESLSVNGHAMQSGESQCAAEAPPTTASSDETPEQQSQLEEGGGGSGGEGGGGGGEEEDDHRKYTISGVTEGSTATESERWEAADSEDASPPPSGADDPQSPPSSPLLSPADRALARLSRSTSCEPSVKRESPPTMDTCDLSLVALEVDSEEDVSADATKDKDGDVRPSPDLTCTRSQSASTPCATATKEPAADQGIRLRSYSYSKISLRPARFARDSPATDPGSEQRPPTVISEQLHEKREAGFRKRAQSADDDGSAALAESLQHLTLSEFLKEIEEEELDKYSIPAKTESEKYKVIRTFSFLKSRMSSTRNKTKGKGKEKEKDREANGHRFSAGACLGSVVCMVCDKQASGKELLHCAGCTAIVHKSCKDSLPPCLKKVQDKYAVASVKSRTASLPQNFTVRDSSPQAPVGPQLLVQPQWEEPPQAAALLAAAVKEAENLKATLSPGAVSPSSLSPRSDTDSVFLSSPAPPVRDVPDHESPPENSAAELPEQQRSQINDMDLKVAQSVQSLTQLLYSLQATVAIQDSCYEVQRLLLRESGRPSPRAQRQHLPSIRGSTLQEQEKQRNLEKQKEEMVAVQRLQEQLRQERERWDRECRARESQRGELASRLEERERRCHLEAERLRRERRELDEQLEEYQQGLERLREGQRNVEKERERLESQQKLLQTWRHGRQRSLPTVIPHMVIPLDGQQEPEPGEPGEHDAERSLFVNEAAFVNRRHKRNDPSAHNCLNTLLARSSSRRSPGAQPPCGPQPDPGDWVMGTGCLYSAAGRLELQHSAGDRSTHGYVVGEAWSPTGGGADRYRVISGPGDPPLDLDALVGNGGGGEEGGEETIVYL